MLGRGYTLARTDTAERAPNPSARCSSSSGTWPSTSRRSWSSTGKPRRNCGSPPPTSRRSWRSALKLAQQPPLIPVQEPEWQADLPITRLEGKLGGVCRGAGASAHEGDPSDHLRPCRGERSGRRGARPPEPSAGPDVPAAITGRGLVGHWSQEDAPDRGSGRARQRPADPGGRSPMPGWSSSGATASGSTRRSSRRAAS